MPVPEGICREAAKHPVLFCITYYLLGKLVKCVGSQTVRSERQGLPKVGCVWYYAQFDKGDVMMLPLATHVPPSSGSAAGCGTAR